MEVVVTGATGFVGRAVVRHLRAAGHRPLALARRQTPDATWVSSYAEAPAADALVHLAEIAHRGAAEAAGSAYEEETSSTLKVLLARGYRRVVYASSGVLYGDRHAMPCRVGMPVEARDRYTRIKLRSEASVLAARGAVLRLANLYGHSVTRGTVLGTILSQIPGTGPLWVQDDTPVRDFLWIDDAAEAFVALVESDVSGIFNVGTGVGTSVRELARAALACAGESHRPIVTSAKPSAASSLVLDIGHTCASLPWRPRTALAEGLGRLLKPQAMSIE
ncbi:MAG: NAD(P)-dependent oxidoreductase [Armatimonadota bacterium]|nr:MAG: NAD(P)-dependent oxidoreductase [Armatimonadota bacterium]